MAMNRLLLAIFVFGSIGVVAELILLEHYEEPQQLIPLIVIALGVGTSLWVARTSNPGARLLFRFLLAIFVIAGALGVGFHLWDNYGHERDEGLVGAELFWAVVKGSAPALAPGTMVLLAAIGYAFMVARAGAEALRAHITGQQDS